MRRVYQFDLKLACLACLAFCAMLTAQSRIPAGAPISDGTARVIELSGQVSVLRNGDLWALMPSGTITPGQEIVSGPDGHAILELSDTSRVEVFPNSRLLFRANRGSWRDLLDLVLGKVRIHIEKLGGQPNPYKVTSPTAFIAVRGTTFEVTVDASETTVVAVEEGIVDVDHRLRPGKSVRLLAGDSLTVYASEPLAESHVDRVRTLTKVIDQVAERAVWVIRQVGGAKGTTAGGASTPAGGQTSGTPAGGVGSTSSGSGSTTPPTSGRAGSGPGNGTGTGTGTPTTPTTPTPTTPTTPPGSGSGSTGPSSVRRPSN